MTVQEAISKIHAPKGVTSIIAGIMNDDFSVLPKDSDVSATLTKADEMVKKYEKDLNECKSDWSYWSILSDLEYWRAVKNILEAGAINNGVVADVQAPALDGCVVMDAISKVSDFGKAVLSETKKIADTDTSCQ